MATWMIRMMALAAVVAVTHGAVEWTRKPANTAASTSDSPAAQMDCQGNFPGLQWTRNVMEAGLETAKSIFINMPGNLLDIPADLQTLYARNSTSPNDLIIQVASVETATYYTCNAGDGQGGTEPAMASFNALDAVECSIPKDSYPELYEPKLTCSVTYWGPLKPRLSWYFMGLEKQGQITEDTDLDGTTVLGDTRRLVSQLNITVDHSHDQTPFQCRLTFDPTDQSNQQWVMPTYTDTCDVLFDVVYKVKDIFVSPNPDDYEDGEFLLITGQHITCNATGSGDLTFLWVAEDSDGPGTVQSHLLPITEAMVGRLNIYTCIARNDVGEAEIRVEFYAKRDPNSGAALILANAWLLLCAIVMSLTRPL